MYSLVNASPPKQLQTLQMYRLHNEEGTGQYFVRSNNIFSCKCISSLTVGCSNFILRRCIGHMMGRVLGNIFCDLDPTVKVKGKTHYLRWYTIDCCSSFV